MNPEIRSKAASVGSLFHSPMSEVGQYRQTRRTDRENGNVAAPRRDHPLNPLHNFFQPMGMLQSATQSIATRNSIQTVGRLQRPPPLRGDANQLHGRLHRGRAPMKRMRRLLCQDARLFKRRGQQKTQRPWRPEFSRSIKPGTVHWSRRRIKWTAATQLFG
jgi:hypothetical protein